MYIFFMLVMGVIVAQFTGYWIVVPFFFLLAIIPAKYVLAGIVFCVCLVALTGCATYNGDVININVSLDSPVGSFPISIRDPNNPYRK